MRQDKLAVTVTPLQVPLGQEEMLATQRGQVASTSNFWLQCQRQHKTAMIGRNNRNEQYELQKMSFLFVFI